MADALRTPTAPNRLNLPRPAILSPSGVWSWPKRCWPPSAKRRPDNNGIEMDRFIDLAGAHSVLTFNR
jgi:hypothetical protein